MHSWAWRVYALLTTGLILAFVAVPKGAPAWGVLWVIEWLVIAALILGPRLHRPVHRRPWRLVTWSMVFMTMGDMGTPLLRAAGMPPAVVDSAQLPFLIGYGFYGASVWTLLRTRAANRDRREMVTDGIVVAVGMATVLWQVLLRPAAVSQVGGAPGLGSNLVTATFPLCQSLITALDVLLLFSGATRYASAWFVFTAGCAAMVANTAYLLQARAGTFEQGSWADAMWTVAYVCAGLAALHPSMRDLTDRLAPAESGRVPFARLTVLAVALLAAPASILADPRLRGPALGVAVASLVLTAIAMWRVLGLIREREQARAELRRTADREAALARLGNSALTGADDAEVLDRALVVLAADLGAGWATFLEPGPGGILDVRAAHGDPDGLVPGPGLLEPVPEQAEVRPGPVAVVPVAGRRDTFGVLVCPAPSEAVELHFARSVANVLAGALERRRAEEEIRHQALHDPLTGLPNRVLLADRLAAALARSERGGSRVAVMFIDLDHFKEVNDTYGHRAGDQLLREVVARVRPLLRAEDTLARFAGDEFVAVAEVAGEADVIGTARRINAALAAPFRLDVAEVRISGSIGVALAEPGATADRLLIDADAAMYQAKELGKDRSEVFAPS
jgi:diguanylate cyclase (GGDEF)-like protein